MNMSPIRPMSRAQVEHFLSVIADPRDRAIFELIYRYGLRVSEAVLINMEDVDLGLTQQRYLKYHRPKPDGGTNTLPLDISCFADNGAVQGS